MTSVINIVAIIAQETAMTSRWPFADPRNVAAFTTRQVIEAGAPMLLVTHDADDGAWQVLCGTTDDPHDARVIGLGRLYDLDPTIGSLADLPLGWQAWRDGVDEPWQRGRAE